MPGKRMIHRNICISQKLSSVSYEAECLYYRILVSADDFGRFHANPHTIKDMCLPYRHVTNTERIRNALVELEKIGLIHRYNVHNVDYLEIERFKDFQILRNDVKKREDFPSRNESVTNTERTRDVEDKVEVEDKDKEERGISRRFTPPSLSMVIEYCKERDNKIDPEAFIAFYSSNGWKVGKNQMKDWHAAIRTWESRDEATKNYRITKKIMQSKQDKEQKKNEELITDPVKPETIQEAKQALANFKMKGVA